MSRPLAPWLYSALRTLFGVVLLGIWAVVGVGRDPDELVIVRQALLCLATFQLFEGVARYEPGPTFPSLSPVVREGGAVAVSLALAVMDVQSTREAEFDYRTTMPVGGTAAMMVLVAAVIHFFVSRLNVSLSVRYKRWRFGVVLAVACFVVGLSLAGAWPASRLGLSAFEALTLPALALIATLMTMPWSWRAWRDYARPGDDPFSDIRARVEAVTSGDAGNDEHLLQLREAGSSMHTFVEATDAGERELSVPVSVVPLIEPGQWLLVTGLRVVNSTRGGSGYRGVSEYERLEGRDEAIPVGELPLPPPAQRRLHPRYVEAALAVAMVLICVVAVLLGRAVYP